ncbi:hypothetical protein C8R44DRAFT_748729 [Mycena epipterygia]|nr:hypothetical protein C8R44DRAFT_748729 [Mycena epipterygia]
MSLLPASLIYGLPPAIGHHAAATPLLRLRGILRDYFIETFRHPSFRQITHLELFYGLEGPWSRLTHLALGLSIVIPVFTQVLAAFKFLCALDPPAEIASLADDPHFVMMDLDIYAENWQTGNTFFLEEAEENSETISSDHENTTDSE